MAEVGRELQRLEHRRVAVGRACPLVIENGRGGTAVAREEQKKVLFQFEERRLRDIQRGDFHRLVGMEPEACEAAVGGDVLVLLADRAIEDLDLDPARLLGQLPRGDVTTFETMQCSQKADRERAGGAQSRAAGMSAMLAISMPGAVPCIRNASRMMG